MSIISQLLTWSWQDLTHPADRLLHLLHQLLPVKKIHEENDLRPPPTHSFELDSPRGDRVTVDPRIWLS